MLRIKLPDGRVRAGSSFARSVRQSRTGAPRQASLQQESPPEPCKTVKAVFTLRVAQVTNRVDYNRVDAPARPTPTVSPQRPGAQSSLTQAPQPARCQSKVLHDRHAYAVEVRAPGQIRPSCGRRWQSCAQAPLREAMHSERAHSRHRGRDVAAPSCWTQR